MASLWLEAAGWRLDFSFSRPLPDDDIDPDEVETVVGTGERLVDVYVTLASNHPDPEIREAAHDAARAVTTLAAKLGDTEDSYEAPDG